MKQLLGPVLLLVLCTSCMKDRLFDPIPASNGTVPTPDSSGTFPPQLNEFMASNTHTVFNPDTAGVQLFNDWVEIYNPNDKIIDLAGYYLTDSLPNTQQFQFASGSSKTIVQPKGYLLVWLDGFKTLGPLHASFSLSKSGESIGLANPNGMLVDSFVYGTQTSDVSMAKMPNGGTLWQACMNPTPGGMNQ